MYTGFICNSDINYISFFPRIRGLIKIMARMIKDRYTQNSDTAVQ